MATVDVGYCLTCDALVAANADLRCPHGHVVNPDLDGPRPWEGRLGGSGGSDRPAGGVVMGSTNGTPRDSMSGSSAPSRDLASGMDASRSSVTNLHLSILQEAPSDLDGAPTVDSNGPTASADLDELADLLGAELLTDHEEAVAVPTPAPDDLADLLAAELDTPDDLTSPHDDLADLLAAELDTPDDLTAAHDDLADLLAAELDTPDDLTSPPRPVQDELADLASLLAVEVQASPQPTHEHDDLFDLLAREVTREPDAPAEMFDNAAVLADLAALGIMDDTPPSASDVPMSTELHPPPTPPPAPTTPEPTPSDLRPVAASSQGSVDLLNFTARGAGVSSSSDGGGRRRRRP